MNQGFKLRFDQLRAGDPTSVDGTAASVAQPDIYPTPGHTRNLCLVWLDGRQMFLNYAYLIACDFSPGDDMNVITLNFSSHQVTLRGYGLDMLFIALLDYLPRKVLVTDPRYVLEDDKDAVVVIDMIVEKPD